MLESSVVVIDKESLVLVFSIVVEVSPLIELAVKVPSTTRPSFTLMTVESLDDNVVPANCIAPKVAVLVVNAPTLRPA